MKTILVFEDGKLLKQISYKTKTEAKKQYTHFLKYGIPDPSTGNKIEKATFELL
jgi:hypothetical protein